MSVLTYQSPIDDDPLIITPHTQSHAIYNGSLVVEQRQSWQSIRKLAPKGTRRTNDISIFVQLLMGNDIEGDPWLRKTTSPRPGR